MPQVWYSTNATNTTFAEDGEPLVTRRNFWKSPLAGVTVYPILPFVLFYAPIDHLIGAIAVVAVCALQAALVSRGAGANGWSSRFRSWPFRFGRRLVYFLPGSWGQIWTPASQE